MLQTIFIIGTVNALFFSVLVFSKKKKTQADYLLGSWIITLGLQLLIPSIYISDLDKFYYLIGIEAIFYVSHPIFLILYTKSLIGRKPSRKKLLTYLLVLIIIPFYMLTWFQLSKEIRLGIVAGTVPIPKVVFVSLCLFMFTYIFFIFRSLLILSHHKKNVYHLFSYRENIDLLWLRRLILGFFILSVLTIPIFSYILYHDIPLRWVDYSYYILIVVFIFLLGYWGYQQGHIFIYQEEVSQYNRKKSKPENDHAEQKEKLSKKAKELELFMKEEKPHLNPTLSIYELSSQTKIPLHILSKIINQEFYQNFFDFTNSFRVEEFKQKIANPENDKFTILALAFECGFNSKSSFNRIFKSKTGLTPNEYRKAQDK